MPGAISSRLQKRGAPQPPRELVDQSWGDGFPVGLPILATPDAERATAAVTMADATADRQLLHGWFPREEKAGRSYRWGAARAAVLVEITRPAGRLHLDFAHVPLDSGGVQVTARRVGDEHPLAPAWSLELPWQFISRSIENHPLELAPGLYEVHFAARRPWSDPPRETRELGLALAAVSLHPGFEVPDGALDMASPAVEQQLVAGWYEAEQDAGRTYRWAGVRGAAVVRTERPVSAVSVDYRVAPTVAQAPRLTVSSLGGERVWAGELAKPDGDWHTDELALALDPGSYLVAVEAARVWSNPDGSDPASPPESRRLGVALSHVSFTARDG
jgi:hypothetical protein